MWRQSKKHGPVTVPGTIFTVFSQQGPPSTLIGGEGQGVQKAALSANQWQREEKAVGTLAAPLCVGDSSLSRRHGL